MSGYVIGLDVGSQSVKGCLLDPGGVLVSTASHPCAMKHPASGWAEQDPGDWRTAIVAVVRRLTADGDAPRNAISHLGLACQVDGVVAADAGLRPQRDAIIWLDRRATRQTAALDAAVGADRVFEVTGLNLDASHAAPKMMWLRDEEPEIYRASPWLLPVCSYIVGWLTGAVVQDPANASSTMLYDIGAGAWSQELAAAAGLELERLPQLRSAKDVAGVLTAAAADALDLPRDCQVIVGTGDEHAASLAAGVLAPGLIADVTGTAEPVCAAAADPVFDAERLVETHAHAVDETLLVENPGFVSGGSVMWLAGLLRRSQPELLALAAEAPAGADGALFLPTLSGAMAPRWNERMRGVFAGLGMNHGEPHLARAVLEGTAYALRDVVDRLAALGLGAAEIRVVGGGARSELWLQIKADVTGHPVRRVLTPEPTALGAAVLAGVAAGHFRDAAHGVELAAGVAEETVVPGPDAPRYREGYDAYRRCFDGVEKALA